VALRSFRLVSTASTSSIARRASSWMPVASRPRDRRQLLLELLAEHRRCLRNELGPRLPHLLHGNELAAPDPSRSSRSSTSASSRRALSEDSMSAGSCAAGSAPFSSLRRMNSRHAATSCRPFGAGFGASLRFFQACTDWRVTPRIEASST
jgi:hypothetical protein